jgi:hypothetical protein
MMTNNKMDVVDSRRGKDVAASVKCGATVIQRNFFVGGTKKCLDIFLFDVFEMDWGF